jgi:hypothetical protein
MVLDAYPFRSYLRPGLPFIRHEADTNSGIPWMGV